MKKYSSAVFCALLVGSGIFLTGCETSLDLPSHNLAKLTIISHLAPGSWEKQRVFVYSSLSPSDINQFNTPALLEVDVTELETETTIRLDSTSENGIVYFEFPDHFLKEGFTYMISAYAPGFKSVRATTVIPKPSTISNLSIQDIRIQPSEKNEFKKIVRYKLVFDIDHVDANRFYHLVFYNAYVGLDNYLLIVDPELSDDQLFLQHYDFGILVDKKNLVPGQPLTFSFVDWVVDDNDLKRVYVELRTITEEYYKYHSTLARQLVVRQDPFAEPVTIFNNIEGGYGNFSGFSPNISSSDLPQ